MKNKLHYLWVLLAVIVPVIGCKDQSKTDATDNTTRQPKLKEENISYSDDDIELNGYVVYDESATGKRPAVLVVHEWWGLNEYPKQRARQLAELGYIAMAVDMYGDGITVDNPKSADSLANPVYSNPQLAKRRVDAALAEIVKFEQTDTAHIAAIGYCFGGGVLINAAKLGANLDGVVSFHGNLVGVPARKDLLKADILVCHGGSDPFVPQQEAETFKKQMDSIGASYTFKEYPGAMHAFTNPAATETGRKFNIPIAYNAAADTASWKDMQEFFGKIFEK